MRILSIFCRHAGFLALIIFSGSGLTVQAEVLAPTTGVVQQYQSPVLDPAPIQQVGAVGKPADDPLLSANPDITIEVEAFQIEGQRSLSEPEIQAILQPYLRRPLKIIDLQNAIDAIKQRYLQQGYFLARVFLPPQSVKDRTLNIMIVEPRYGSVSAQGSPRLSGARIAGMLEKHEVLSGNDIVSPGLERSLLLLGMQPATDTYVKLQPGQQLGTSDLSVEARAGNLLSGQLAFDNYANRLNGEYRTSAQLRLNSPSGQGDDLVLRAIHAADHDYAYATYQFPVGYDGFKLGASLSRLDYQICCELSALKFRGGSTTASLYAAYPLLLAKNTLVYSGLAYTNKWLRDEALGVELSDRNNRSLQFSLAGMYSNAATTRFNLAYSIGEADLSGNRFNQQQDALAARTDGS